MWDDANSGWVLRAGADTQLGNYRETNEDFVLLDPELPLALVLDGAGPGGARAARVGAEAMCDRARLGGANGEPPEAVLGAAFRAGHDAVVRMPGAAEFRYAATAVAAWICAGRAFVTWLGNGSALHLSGGTATRLTYPHTFRGLLVKQGRMTEQEARDTVGRNPLLGLLGDWNPDIELEILSFLPQPGDRLILTSDGVDPLLDEDTFVTACRTIDDPTICAEALIEHALMRGSRDNCACAVITFDRSTATPAPVPPTAPDPPTAPAAPPARKWWQFWK
jgi:protein phosphatase